MRIIETLDDVDEIDDRVINHNTSIVPTVDFPIACSSRRNILSFKLREFESEGECTLETIIETVIKMLEVLDDKEDCIHNKQAICDLNTAAGWLRNKKHKKPGA